MISAQSPADEAWVQDHVSWLWGFKLESFQLDIALDLIQGGIYSVLLPTDHGKFTLLMISIVLGLIREPTRSNLLIKISDDKAREDLKIIVLHLITAAEEYAHVKPLTSWRNHEPQVNNYLYVAGAERKNPNPSLFAAGIRTSDLQGRRGRTHIDDVEEIKEARSPAYQQLLDDQVARTLRTLEPRPDALWAMFGTPYHANSVYFGIPRKLEPLGPHYKVIQRPAVNAQGDYLWPWRRDKIQIHKLAMSDLEWQVAYLLRPPDFSKLLASDIEAMLDPDFPFCPDVNAASAFLLHRLHQQNTEEESQRLLSRARWYIGWDPAARGEFGIVADVLADRHCYILDAYRQPGDMFTQVQIMSDLHARFPQACIIIERNGQQKAFIDVLRERLPQAVIIPHMTDQSKDSETIGIPSMLDIARHGYLHLPTGDARGRNVADLFTKEMHQWPGKHPHLLPALWFTTFFDRKNAVQTISGGKMEEPYRETSVIDIGPRIRQNVEEAWKRSWR